MNKAMNDYLVNLDLQCNEINPSINRIKFIKGKREVVVIFQNNGKANTSYTNGLVEWNIEGTPTKEEIIDYLGED